MVCIGNLDQYINFHWLPIFPGTGNQGKSNFDKILSQDILFVPLNEIINNTDDIPHLWDKCNQNNTNYILW